MNPIIVCFSGRIAIGKTSVSRALAERLDCPWTGFGDYVRAIATKRGLDSESRDVLQDTGASLIAEQGFRLFCSNVVAAANWSGDCPLIIDGIRHIEALQTIKELLAPSQVVLVHLAVESEEALYDRTMLRGIEFAERVTWETHSTERQVLSTLPEKADLIVSADLPLPDVVERVVGFVIDVQS